MKEYAWLFPLIFIFHDMEEIIGFGIWLKKNKQFLQEKYPWAIAPYKNFSTEGFSLAVFEELIICILFSLIVVITENPIISYLWLGGFIGCTFHFVLHIGQAIVMRKYIPAVITSVICLPISVWIIYKCFLQISEPLLFPIIFIVVGIIVVAVNLKFAQKLIGWFTRKMRIDSLI